MAALFQEPVAAVLFLIAGVVIMIVFTVWFVCHGRYWAKRTSRWDIPGIDK